MSGQELADSLFAKIDKGVAADDPVLVDETVAKIAAMSPEDTWWFVIRATALDRERKERGALGAFNAAANQRPSFLEALKAMQAVPRPDKPT